MLVVFAAAASLPVPAGADDAEVTIKNTAFNPQGVTVEIGEKVVWKAEEAGHDITFDDGSYQQPRGCTPLGLGCTQDGDRFERTFTTAGAFKYHCSRHGTGMSGLVNVQGPAQATTTTVATTATAQAPTTVTTAGTTTTTRKLATSSTLPSSTTTTTVTEESSTTLTPNEAPAFDPDDDGDGGTAAPAASGGDGGGPGTVALIVAALLAVAGGGGVLLWRLRPRPGGS